MILVVDSVASNLSKSKDAKKTMHKQIIFLSLFLVTSHSAPSIKKRSIPATSTNQKRGKCSGSALNFFRYVVSLDDCIEKCDNDIRCSYYSYHFKEDGPHHAHCYLYSESECSTVRYDQEGSHWSYGHPPRRTPTVFFRAS